jgi:hypothetical protein
MKRRLIYGLALFVLMSWALTSCESLGTCKVCRQVTYVDGVVTLEGDETEYCDSKLVAIEATPDVVQGSTRIKWECR